MLPYVWITCLVVPSTITGISSELCVSTHSSTDLMRTNKTQFSSTEECQWGCCSKTESPCCSVPINLLIGVSLGGVVIVSIAIALIYYYCIYTRCDICMHALLRCRERQPASDPRIHGNTSYQAGSSDEIVLPTHPEYNDLPPSYEEVMKGRTNVAYVPDTLDRGITAEV
ncbi:hypothetical protein BsWGS_13932 [Bradybaena similaris]